MSSICMERRDRNQVKIEARRIETTGGMIGDLITSGEQIRENQKIHIVSVNTVFIDER